MPRPHVVLSVAVSLDGRLDDVSPQRLLLSNDDDFDRVDQLRADSDAILIGAGTLRADNPRLIVKNPQRRARRVAEGRDECPLKVTVSGSGKLDRDAKFWHHGNAKLAYTTDQGKPALTSKLAGLAEVVSLGPSIDFGKLLDDLGNRGVRHLMVEGGGTIHTQFLTHDLADELLMAVAPIVVGEEGAPPFLLPSTYPSGRFTLERATTIGDVVLLHYLPRKRSAAA